MSRSRKYPIFKDNPSKWGKKQANKKIRQTRDLQGFIGFNFLHKLFDSINICDWRKKPNPDKVQKASRK